MGLLSVFPVFLRIHAFRSDCMFRACDGAINIKNVDLLDTGAIGLVAGWDKNRAVV